MWTYWSNPIELGHNEIAKQWRLIVDSFRLHRQELGLSLVFAPQLNSLGELDARLRYYEQKLSQMKSSDVDLIMLEQAQMYFSELWIMHANEMVRLITRIKPNKFDTGGIKEFYNNTLKPLRVRVSKHVVPEREDNKDSPAYAYPTKTIHRRFGWMTEKGSTIFRTDIANQLMSLLSIFVDKGIISEI